LEGWDEDETDEVGEGIEDLKIDDDEGPAEDIEDTPSDKTAPAEESPVEEEPEPTTKGANSS
jgi:hypothetical protein